MTTSHPEAADRSRRDQRDEGATLVIALVMILLCGFIVIPSMGYAMAVGRAGQVATVKANRVEAVKGGLRAALADPQGLYKKCGYQDAANPGAGLYRAVAVASPGLRTDVVTNCYMMDYAQSRQGDSIGRFGVAAVAVGATLPEVIVNGGNHAYPGSGQAPEGQWINDVSLTETIDKIWLPDLPAHALNRRSVSGFAMPAGFNDHPACTVYFPGTYQDELVITGSTPVFFTSGIYYFEKGVRVSGNADVVVGDGANLGCASDQEAAFYAIDAPAIHNITGLGATWVFGANGRLVVDTDTPGATTSLLFNLRYVSETDVSTASSAGVSIMSVNGLTSGSATTDLVIPGFLAVPRSMVGGDTRTEASAQSYAPSLLVPAAPAPPTTTTTVVGTTTTLAGPTTTAAPTTTLPPPPPIAPIIEVRMTTAQKVTVSIPGYVSTPQGTIRVTTTPGAEANKSISIAGGMLAARIELDGTAPGELGYDNPVVQQTFKLVSETTAGSPKVVSIAIVQINQNGAYAVNTWVVQ